jgi:zinc protease
MFENHRREKWFFLALLFILALLAFLLLAGLHARAKDNLNSFIDIRTFTTPKGITVWHVEDKTLPIISLSFLFRDAGSAYDPDDKQGLTRLLSNTMDEGAGKITAQDFQRQLSDNSISLSFESGRDNFGGSLVTLSRNKDLAFNLLSLAINKPRFDEEAVFRMRDANLARIKSSLSEADWIAARLMNDRAFDGHPYAKNSGGTISGLGAITSEDLKAVFRSDIVKDKLIVAAAGDISQADLSNAVDMIFSSLPQSAQKTKIPDIKEPKHKGIVLYKKDIPQTMVEIMLPAFDQKDPDAYALQVLNYIFGGAGFGSRLMEKAREEKGLTYGIYSSILDMRHADMMNISTSTKNETTAEIISIIKAEMEKLKTQKVSEKELTDAKSYITGSMPLALKSTESLSDIALSLQEQEKPVDYLDHYAQHIMAVTPDDVLRVANRVLNENNMSIILVGQPENITPTQIIESIPNVQ